MVPRALIIFFAVLAVVVAPGPTPVRADERAPVSNHRPGLLASLVELYGLGRNEARQGLAALWPDFASSRGRERLLPELHPAPLPGTISLRLSPLPSSAQVGPVPGLGPAPPLVSSHVAGSAEANLGSYYARSGFQYNDPGADLAPAPPVSRKPGMTVSMAAGTQRRALNAGVLYAYQAGYQPPAGDQQADARLELPFYIFSPRLPGKSGDASSLDDAHAVFFYLGYDVNEQLQLRGALGFARLEDQDKNDPALNRQSRRWGVDLAASYRLLDNLVYEAHLGYVNSDDHQDGSLSLGDDPAALPQDQQNTVYQLSNQLRMTF